MLLDKVKKGSIPILRKVDTELNHEYREYFLRESLNHSCGHSSVVSISL
jgi:hypothetical protein